MISFFILILILLAIFLVATVSLFFYLMTNIINTMEKIEFEFNQIN
jgi:hypothetical protein